MAYTFITNDLLIKRNRSLKNRGQFEVSLEVELVQLSRLAGIEEFADGTHFKVTIEPITADTNE